MCRTSEMTENQLKKFQSTEEKVQYDGKAKGRHKGKPDKESSDRNKKKYAQNEQRSLDRINSGQRLNTRHSIVNTVEILTSVTRESVQRMGIFVENAARGTSLIFKAGVWFVVITMTVPSIGVTGKVKCQMDTGLTCNLISKRYYSNLTQDFEHSLEPSRVSLNLYDNTRLEPLGKCDIQCQVGKVTKTKRN